MSRRTILSLVASVIMGIGFVGTVSTDASAYYRRGVGVYRGGVYRGGVYRGVRPGVAAGPAAAAGRAAAPAEMQTTPRAEYDRSAASVFPWPSLKSPATPFTGCPHPRLVIARQ